MCDGRYEFQGEVAKNQMSSAVRSDLLKSLTLIVTYSLLKELARLTVFSTVKRASLFNKDLRVPFLKSFNILTCFFFSYQNRDDGIVIGIKFWQ